jgi:CBS domain-containing membrane protein
MERRPAKSMLTEQDLRAALVEMKTYVDVTEEDLKKIFEIALRHAQERIASQIPVGDIMTKNVVAVKKDADLHETARLLSENQISGMPVIDDEKRVIGVISEVDILLLAGMKREHTFRDILRSILGEQLPVRKTGNRVHHVMSFPPITAKADDFIGDVANIFDQRRIKRLPVVDDNGTLVGIISRADIVRAISKIP